MFRNYIKTAFRQAKRDRLYTGINLAGLSTGIACCALIFLFVSQELSYDRFHSNADTIFRIATLQTEEGSQRQFAHAYLPLGPLLQSGFPEVDKVVRLFPQSVSITNKEMVVQEEIYYADSSFFDVFSFALSHGNIHTALKDPNNIILTEQAAKRYFGNANPMDKELVIENKTAFKVAGVLRSIPSHSSLRFDFLVPMAAARQVMGDWVFGERSWHYPTVYTYVKLKEHADAKTMQEKLITFSRKDLPAMARGRTHFMQPITGIHFSSLENEPQPTININILYLFIIVGLVILLLAAFNFINLFLSRIVFRLKGVAIQKVLGAGNRIIWWQTFTETMLYLFCSLLLSVACIIIFLPVFNAIMDKELVLFSATTLRAWALIGLLLVLTGFLTALFPAIILARLQLHSILKGKIEWLFPRKRTLSLQSLFVIAQFTIAFLLIVATIIMQSQLYYIRNKQLGLQSEQVLVIPVRDAAIQDNVSTVKNELLTISGVKQVSAISNFPWARGFHDFETIIRAGGRNIAFNAPTLLVEADFIATMDMTIIKGRGFSKDLATDAAHAFIMNETAASKFGITDPSGVTLVMTDVVPGQPKQGKLIGIVKDFHLQSLHEKVEPLLLAIAPAPHYLDNLVIRLSGADIPATLKTIETTLKARVPGKAIDYFFLENAFEKLYEKEARLVSLFNYFSMIAIIIACMGLFGIVAFTAARRTKEIGIRKVAGASTAVIVQLLSKDFVKLVILAILIASPIAWYLMNRWLQHFAYRITINAWIFAIAGMAVLLLAWMTMALQAIKAARANPVKSLRAE